MKTTTIAGSVIFVALLIVALVSFHINQIKFNSFVMGTPTAAGSPVASYTQGSTASVVQATAQPQAQINGDSYKVLVEYFQREVSMVLEITKWVVLILGGLGGLGGFYIFTRVEDFKKDIRDLETDKTRIKSDLDSINKDLIVSKARMDQYQIFSDLQNDNPDIRLRALGRLGTSDDIAQVFSTLTTVLQKDKDIEVKREASYMLNSIMKYKVSEDDVSQNKHTFNQCAEILGTTLSIKDDELQKESLLAIQQLVKLKLPLPRSIIKNIKAHTRFDVELKKISDGILSQTDHTIS